MSFKEFRPRFPTQIETCNYLQHCANLNISKPTIILFKAKYEEVKNKYKKIELHMNN